MRQTSLILIALTMLGFGWQAPAAQGTSQAEKLFASAQHKEVTEGDLKGAIEQYKKIAEGTDRAMAAQALVRMAGCFQKLGDAEARATYERVVRLFADQPGPFADARARLAMLGSPSAPSAKATRQVWSGPGVDGDGAPSPDGRYLTFTDWVTGDLAIRDLGTGINRRLTNTGGWVASGDYASESIVSPDGRQVAYAWFLEQDFKNELRVVPLTSATPAVARTLVRVERTEYLKPVAWSPDGQHVFVVRSLQDHTNQIGTVSVRDGSFRSLKSLEWRYPDRVSLSPDGQTVAYDVPAGDGGSPRDILLLATDGSREIRFVQGPANDTQPVWSPDGSRVLFLSDRTGTMALWSRSVAAGVPVGAEMLVKPDLGIVTLLGIARSGTLYYYTVGATRRNVYVVDFDSLRVDKASAPLTENFINGNVGPSWSHDGQYLAYYSSRNPMVLVIRTVSTGSERLVPLPVGVIALFNAGPRWFPDNRTVLILSRDAQGSGFGFHRLAIDTGKTDLLWHINRFASSFDLSPDGASIFCAFQNNGEPSASPVHSGRLIRFDIDSRREVELKKGEWFITLAVSPDGGELAYLKSVRTNHTEYPGVIEVMPTEGGPSREVYRHPVWLDGSRYNALTWTPDQRFLLFVRGEEQNDSTLWRVPAAGGSPEKASATLNARLKSPTVRPDGKQLAFGLAENDDNEVWALENFLPRVAASR